MNISQLARKLRVSTDELRAKLPELGFDIGAKALKVPDRDVGRIQYAWRQYKRREYLNKKAAEQKARAERKKAVKEGTAEIIELPDFMTVRDFAAALNLPLAKVMQELMRAGILASLNERIDFDTAAIIAEDLGKIAKKADGSEEAEEEVEVLEAAMNDAKAEDLENRPPVIVVMGHVDHGKTLLLDAIRSTNVVEGESGGITQHIGAYQVERNGKKITCIDTPGHEAFTVMRSRGAKVADIAILVVAADDGVQPQTKEAVDIIKAAKLPYVVAINKVDKPAANVERVKSELSQHGLIPEEWGGESISVPVSAKTGQGIEELLDAILLVEEMEQEKIVADPSRRAIGTIIESHVDPGQGPVATALVQTGTLHVGDHIGMRGMHYGKVRAMKSWNGTDVKEADPSTPVKILGFKAAPSVGDILEVPENVKDLEKLKAQPTRRAGVDEVVVTHNATAMDEDSDEEKPTLNLIIKSDVLGSLEAIIGMIEKIDTSHVRVKIISRGLGNVTDADVLSAEATGAFIAAFNVKPPTSVAIAAREKEVEIGEYSVIYKLFDDVVERLRALLPDEKIHTELGTLKVLAIFMKVDKGTVIGGQVTSGVIEKDSIARVIRDGEIIAEGKIAGLQSGKVDVRDVEQGQECGIQFHGKVKFEVGDVLETYKEETKARKLNVEGIS